MAPTSDENSLEMHLERQMGCMAGLLQIFDRSQLVHSKRIYGSRRFHSFPATSAGSTSPSERAEYVPPSPEKTPARSPLPLPLPVFDSWKVREAPRLSLDSRLQPRETRVAIPVPAKCSGGPDTESEKIRRPPSVVARLMGLDALPAPVKKAELRRSASESRVPRDPCRFAGEDFVFKKHPTVDLAPERGMESRSKPPPPQPTKTSLALRKNFFDAYDFFPDPNRTGSRSIYNEIERRLRMRGIDEPAKDLETLKLILEASQLKGLLHCRPSDRDIDRRPPIVVLEPDPTPVRRPVPDPRRIRRQMSPDPNARKPRSPEPRRRVPPQPKNSSSAVRSPRNQRLTADVSPNDLPIRSPSPPLLERCDELLRSITAFTSVDQQPSPVSVLDSPFLPEDGFPSPVKIESADWEDDRWAQSVQLVGFNVPESDSTDFAYVYDILRFSDRLLSLDDVYILLEKRHGATDLSEPSVLHRRLIFDAVTCIISRKHHVSAWEAFSRPSMPSGADQLIREVWLEVRRTREWVAAADDLDGVTCGAIQKDIAGGIGGDHGWSDASAEMSDAVVLHVERMLFKDVIAETIRNLADVSDGKSLVRHRRKLVF